MGNQHSSQKIGPNQIFAKLKNYEVINQNEEDVIYRLKFSATDTQEQYYEYFILKEYYYGNKERCNQDYCKFVSQISNNRNEEYQSNTLRIKEVAKQLVSSLCANTYIIYVLYEYPELKLNNQIEVRADLKRYFSQQELVAILQTCVLSLEQIKSYICFNTNCIFITNEGTIKVLHDDLVDENCKYLLSQNIYYSPQKILNFDQQNASDISIKKQIIFSLGMTMLETCFLEPFYRFYNYNENKFDETGLQMKIQQLRTLYSADFVDLLQNMLEINPNRRISLLQIQRVLNRLDQITYVQNEDNGISRNYNYDILTYESNRSDDEFYHKSSQIYQNIVDSSSDHPNELKDLVNADMNRPKNVQAQNCSENLFTDPKLLEMIRKDLMEINKSKTSRLNFIESPSNYSGYLEYQSNFPQNHQNFLKKSSQLSSLQSSIFNNPDSSPISNDKETFRFPLRQVQRNQIFITNSTENGLKNQMIKNSSNIIYERENGNLSKISHTQGFRQKVSRSNLSFQN